MESFYAKEPFSLLVALWLGGWLSRLCGDQQGLDAFGA
jgi:hypothetical protein